MCKLQEVGDRINQSYYFNKKRLTTFLLKMKKLSTEERKKDMSINFMCIVVSSFYPPLLHHRHGHGIQDRLLCYTDIYYSACPLRKAKSPLKVNFNHSDCSKVDESLISTLKKGSNSH